MAAAIDGLMQMATEEAYRMGMANAEQSAAPTQPEVGQMPDPDMGIPMMDPSQMPGAAIPPEMLPPEGEM